MNDDSPQTACGQRAAACIPALADFDADDLAARLARWGHNPSHAARMLRDFYLSGGSIDARRLKLPKGLERRLDVDLAVRASRIARRVAGADGTVKLLVEFASGGAVETVLMPSHDGRRAAGCVSCQIGCSVGCCFCASGADGLERNLTAGEIVEQFLHLRALAAASGRRLATLVFMGMGEPMHNLPNVISAIRRIARPGMGELGARNITVSTVGIVEGIHALAAADLNVHLAISLHAPDDLTRRRIIPLATRYPVAEIVGAARRFQQLTGRIVTVEYCLIRGLNDSPEHAAALAALLDGFRAHVNLIPFNSAGADAARSDYEAPPPETVAAFADMLRTRGAVTHVRRSRGADIAAACGQLRLAAGNSRQAAPLRL